MDIGKKIYNLRTSKLMTQAELAGDQITRNMLCLIEKGAANPSLSTILYIAKKLNVPAGYLLAEDGEEAVYCKVSSIENIKKAYVNCDFEICRDICLECISKGVNDDEINFVLAETDIAIAKKEIFGGALKSAIDYISEALEYCQKTVYYTKHIENMASVYASYMSEIAPSLDMGLERSEFCVSDDLFYNYMYVFCGMGEFVSNELADKFKDSFYYKHLAARKLINEGKYDDAFSYLSEFLKVDDEIPRPVLYSVFSDLERCCKERDDFKGAYEYSSNKRQLFEKMLSEN